MLFALLGATDASYVCSSLGFECLNRIYPIYELVPHRGGGQGRVRRRPRVCGLRLRRGTDP